MLLCSSCFMGTGCNVTGPVAVKTGRGMYNNVIQGTGNEQLLQNLVRLKYRDTPFFMEVASISTSFEFTASAGANATLPDASPDTYGLSGGLSYIEKPTVTYTPLQGDRFVMQLMKPISLDIVLLLYHSGWSIERIFRLTLQSINDIKNAPSASGPTPERVPRFETFLRISRILRSLQKKDVLDLGRTEENGSPGVVLHIDETAKDWPEVTELRDLLDLDPSLSKYRLIMGTGRQGTDSIVVMTRSLSGCLFYISQSVQVPECHKVTGLVTVTRYDDGLEFDWNTLTTELITIKFSPLPPLHAYIRVYYRGIWFYIADNDLDSKSTFSLLTQLFALQAGEIKSVGPILTLPVSR